MINMHRPYSPHKFKIYLFLLLTLITFMSTTWEALGQDSDGGNRISGLNVRVVAGYGGYYRPGSWVPIFVSISNRPDGSSSTQAEDFTGQLMMLTSPVKGNSAQVQYLRRIDVPASSEKRYTLYIKLAEDIDRIPSLRINSENGKLLQQLQVDLQQVDKDKLLQVHISDELGRPPLPTFRGEPDNIFTSTLSPDLLPDHWSAYDSVDIITFSKWPGIGMGEQQAKALEDWVKMGGTLVFLGGSETISYSDEFSQDLLPVEINGSVRLDQRVSGEFEVITQSGRTAQNNQTKSFVLTNATPKIGSEVILEIDRQPIAVKRDSGLGKVIFFSLDLKNLTRSLELVISDAWLPIIPIRDLGSYEYEFIPALEGMKILTGRAARPPNVFIIILICAIYTIIVGPVNFGLLAKMKKLEYAWFSVPVIVFFFFIMIYALGKWTKGGENIIREVRVETLSAKDMSGKVERFIGYFVSEEGNYFFRPTDPYQATDDLYQWKTIQDLRSRAFGGVGLDALGASSSPLFDFEDQQNNVFISNWPLSTYDAQRFRIRGTANIDEGIRPRLTYTGDGLRGTIINDSESVYKESFVIYGDRIYPLGELKAGETKELPRRPMRQSFEVQARPETESEVNYANANLFLNAMINPPISGQFFPPHSGQIEFYGLYEPERTISNLISNVEPDLRSEILLRRVTLEADYFSNQRNLIVPPQDLKVSLINYSMEGYDGFRLESGQKVLKMSESEGIFAVELPFENSKAEVVGVQINPSILEDRQEVKVEVYQYKTNAPGWREVEVGQATIRNEGFIMPYNGRMLVKISSRTPEDASGISLTGGQSRLSSLGITYYVQMNRDQVDN